MPVNSLGRVVHFRKYTAGQSRTVCKSGDEAAAVTDLDTYGNGRFGLKFGNSHVKLETTEALPGEGVLYRVVLNATVPALNRPDKEKVFLWPLQDCLDRTESDFSEHLHAIRPTLCFHFAFPSQAALISESLLSKTGLKPGIKVTTRSAVGLAFNFMNQLT
ncbi:hypothetical protein J6590_002196 [Homalodisca vitripennis]|nr:hypothetical protein J6590_002196 [Homalodisca vitripennis]